MLGQPFGPKCGRRYGLAPERRIRVKAPKRGDDEIGQPVLDGLEEEINESER